MLPNQKLLDILGRLLEKSRTGQVNWQESESPREFVVSFSESTLSVRYVSPATESDCIVVLLKDNHDKELWRLVVEEGDPGWPDTHELFLEAKRRAMGLDSVLDKIEKELIERRDVGLPF